MEQKFLHFLSDESGAVTVDWVVLTAAIVGLGVAVITTVSLGATATGDSLGASLDAANVASMDADLF